MAAVALLAWAPLVAAPESGLAGSPLPGFGPQENPVREAVRLVATPEALVLRAGESARLAVGAIDAEGTEIAGARFRITAPRNAARIQDGVVTAITPGDYEIVATLAPSPGASSAALSSPAAVRIPLTVLWPLPRSVSLTVPEKLFAGTRVSIEASVELADGSDRPDARLDWRSSDSSVARVDAFGNLELVAEGSVFISAGFEGAEGSVRREVREFPGASISLRGLPDVPVRTGDVVRFRAAVRDEDGVELSEVPTVFSHSYRAPPDMAGAAAAAGMWRNAFVADLPGVHTVRADAGPLAASVSFEVVARDVVRPIEVTGHAGESWYRTTDIWVFEGTDGRDYAVTGSKVSGGYAFFYDVTDPAAIVKYDSVQVDARTVNDVKASPDGRYVAISREGTTTRRDGLVIVDMSEPASPRVASFYDDGITGGVHNVFATDRYLYALAGGDKYVIIDMADIRAPRFAGEYNHPDSRLHDVWVHDGIAYSSEWETGVVVVDVGNGRWGGSPEQPVFVTSFPTPSGATHAAFPYYQEETGKTYLFLGDEIMSRRGLAWPGYPRSMGSYAQRYDSESGAGGIPLATRGYVHIVDFTDPEAPEMVARYEVPEFGTHNMWIEDDKLYQAYYEGGLRVVDVSGELMGNLYTQGREIAVFKSVSPEGYAPNATMVWGVMPHKGHVFFADTNSGLWAVRLTPRSRPIS